MSDIDLVVEMSHPWDSHVEPYATNWSKGWEDQLTPSLVLQTSTPLFERPSSVKGRRSMGREQDNSKTSEHNNHNHWLTNS